MAKSGDVFLCHNWGGDTTVICYIEARGTVKHPTIKRTVAPMTNN